MMFMILMFFNDFYDFDVFLMIFMIFYLFLMISCVIMFFAIGMLRQDLASNGSRPKGLRQEILFDVKSIEAKRHHVPKKQFRVLFRGPALCWARCVISSNFATYPKASFFSRFSLLCCQLPAKSPRSQA